MILEEDEKGERLVNIVGTIIIFSFLSSIIFFVAMIILASLNNYGMGGLVQVGDQFINLNIIDGSFSTVLDETATNTRAILPYLDYLWFISFIILIAGSLLFSYFRNKQSYFTLMSNIVIGIIIFTYVGGIIMQVTNWFNSEILFRVFPTFADSTPIFYWYLRNVWIVNLIIISLTIILNYVEFDLSKFNQSKGGEDLGEI